MMKKVLVTGADGFIGSHLVESLVHRGYTVRAFVFYNSLNTWGWLDTLDSKILKQLEVVSGDIRDPHGVRTAMKGCEFIFHLAALIAIPYSYHSPTSYVETNVTGTLNVVQAARELNVGKVIHISTSEVYGTAQYVPIDEKHPLQPQSPYSASKIGADTIAMSFYHSFDLPLTIARPFNTYGPRQSARAVIPAMITQIANGRKEIHLGDTTPTRDFNYVRDTCQGLIELAECSETIGHTINVGSNTEISIQKVFDLIKNLMQSDVRFCCDQERIRPKKSEVFRLCCDNRKIKKLTGFEPQYSLIDGLEKTIEWLTIPKNLARYKTDIYNV